MNPTPTTTLDELFRRMRAGSARERDAAWGEVYQRYRELVWTRVFYVVRSISWLAEPREVAEDVTSDVFVSLPDAIARYREEGKAEQWLKQIAVRAALRARERLTGQWRKGDEPPAPARRHESFDEEAEHITRFLDDVEREELMELERRIDALRTSADPKEQRWAEFIDLYRQGYGYAEIGERMRVTEGTARNWLVAIRKHLATPLAAGRPADGGAR
jgi:RNA polymerase sigma factor (sigma-70 family)